MSSDEADRESQKLRQMRQMRKEKLENQAHNLHFALVSHIARTILPGGFWRKNIGRHDDKSTLHLTFDDGPYPETTPALLDLLDEFGVKATFFFIGDHIRQHPDLAVNVLERGHEIGNHSMTHRLLLSLSRAEIAREIDDTNALITSISGLKPRLFRPPYGLLDNRTARMLEDRRMVRVYWGAMASDFRPIGTNKVVERILQQIKNENLIVLHEGDSKIAAQTIASTRRILEITLDKGYRFEPII